MSRTTATAGAARKAVVAGAGIVAAGTLGSRILGFARDKTVAHFFTPGPATDAYWAAFSLPDLLYLLLVGGTLSAAFIPVFCGYLVRNEEEEGSVVASSIANLMLLLLAAGCTLIILLAPQLVWLFLPGFHHDPARYRMCVSLTRVLALVPPFMGLSALSTALLQSYYRFLAPAMAWVIYNIPVVVIAILAHARWGVAGLAWAVVAGAVGLVAIQLPALRGTGFRYRRVIRLDHPGVRQVIRLFLLIVPGMALSQISLLVLPNMLGSLSQDTVTHLRFASRLIVAPLGLFGMAISVAAFPAMSREYQAGASDEFKLIFSSSLRAIIFLMLPAAVGLMALHEPIIRTLWESGKFTDDNAQATAFILFFWAIGSWALGALQLVNRGFYSRQQQPPPGLSWRQAAGFYWRCDVLVPLKVGVVAAAINLLLAWGLLYTPLSYGGIGLAGAFSMIFAFSVSLETLRRRLGGIRGREVLSSFLRVLAASLVMAAAAWGTSFVLARILHLPPTRFGITAPVGQPILLPVSSLILQLVASIGVGVAAFLAAAFALRIPEAKSAWERIARRFRRAACLQ